MKRQKVMVKAVAILASSIASLGASTLIASPWGIAAEHAAKMKRMKIELERAADRTAALELIKAYEEWEAQARSC